MTGRAGRIIGASGGWRVLWLFGRGVGHPSARAPRRALPGGRAADCRIRRGSARPARARGWLVGILGRKKERWRRALGRRIAYRAACRGEILPSSSEGPDDVKRWKGVRCGRGGGTRSLPRLRGQANSNLSARERERERETRGRWPQAGGGGGRQTQNPRRVEKNRGQRGKILVSFERDA